MPSNTDALVMRFAAERQERETFLDNVVETAQAEKRDLTEQEMTLVTRTKERIPGDQRADEPASRTRCASPRSRASDRPRSPTPSSTPATPSASPWSSTAPRDQFIMDIWQSGMGVEEATNRLDVYKPGRRAPDHG